MKEEEKRLDLTDFCWVRIIYKGGFHLLTSRDLLRIIQEPMEKEK